MTAEDRDSCQPLHVAVCGRKWSVCRLLLEAAADPTVPDGMSGMTPKVFITFAEDEDHADELAGLRSLVGLPTGGFWVEEGEDAPACQLPECSPQPVVTFSMISE